MQVRRDVEDDLRTSKPALSAPWGWKRREPPRVSIHSFAGPRKKQGLPNHCLPLSGPALGGWFLDPRKEVQGELEHPERGKRHRRAARIKTRAFLSSPPLATQEQRRAFLRFRSRPRIFFSFAPCLSTTHLRKTRLFFYFPLVVAREK